MRIYQLVIWHFWSVLIIAQSYQFPNSPWSIPMVVVTINILVCHPQSGGTLLLVARLVSSLPAVQDVSGEARRISGVTRIQIKLSPTANKIVIYHMLCFILRVIITAGLRGSLKILKSFWIYFFILKIIQATLKISQGKVKASTPSLNKVRVSSIHLRKPTIHNYLLKSCQSW